MKTLGIAILSLWCLAGPTAAEVVSRDADGFRLNFQRPVTARPETLWAAAVQPDAWWSDAHTYSGSASNIRLEPVGGGCWCEDLPGGGVKHGEVVLAWPEQRTLRVDAPFGPLQSVGADAVLTMTWADPEGDAPRLLRWTYVVTGPGTGAMAEAIDGVMTEQFARLGAHLDGLSTAASDLNQR